MNEQTNEQPIALILGQPMVAGAAFETLLRRHAGQVHRLASSVVGAGAADDVVQEVFLSVHRNLSTFRREARFSTWLHRVTLNACSAALRKPQPDSLALLPEPAACNDPAQAGEQVQIRERLAWALQPHHRHLSGVLFGATVLAVATSLPVISTAPASLRLGDYELAISDIFGGNAFLPVLSLLASLISGQAVLPLLPGRSGQCQFFGRRALRVKNAPVLF